MVRLSSSNKFLVNGGVMCAAFGVAQIPFRSCVEIESIAEVRYYKVSAVTAIKAIRVHQFQRPRRSCSSRKFPSPGFRVVC